MKAVYLVILCLCGIFTTCNAQTKEQPNTCPTGICDPIVFDEYTNIPFKEEKARLDNLAIQLQLDPNYIGYFLVYAGQRSCIGEAQARAVRAKNYLVN